MSALEDFDRWFALCDEQARRDTYLRSLSGRPVDVTIKVHRNTRSNKANAFYWGAVIALLAEHCGYEPEEMHEALAMRFLRIEDDPWLHTPRRKHTPLTDTKEFGEYVDQCIRFAALELGVVIPSANEIEVSQ